MSDSHEEESYPILSIGHGSFQLKPSPIVHVFDVVCYGQGMDAGCGASEPASGLSWAIAWGTKHRCPEPAE